jgi:F-type H+-transporting ATPase subunit a
VKEKNVFRWKNQRRRQDQSPFFHKFGSRASKDGVTLEMNDQLAQRVVYNVHSYIRDFFRPELHPDSVLKLLYEDGQLQLPVSEEIGTLFKVGVQMPKPIVKLFKLYGILDDKREPLVSEITKMIDMFLREDNLVLPPEYTVSYFVGDMFLGWDSPESLKETFTDLFLYKQGSLTYDAGVLTVFQQVWEAELPDPFSPPLSNPGSPLLNMLDFGSYSPQSVFYDNQAAYEAAEAIGGAAGNLLEWFSPLDQFAIHALFGMNIGNFYFSFTNLALSMLLTLGFVVVLCFVVTKKGGGKSVPNALQSLVEQIYDFVLNLVNEQIGGLSGNVKQKFFPCISVTFTFSLFRNPQGMIPFSFTVTSHFLITLALSFSIFIGITIVGFQRHGLHFFSFLLPAGVPLPLAPFLVLLELISYCFRALSLGIRLFANMMAGHSLVKILSGFAWTMLFLNNIFYFIGDLGPLFIILALTGLELGVAILQAHVSTISICIYLNDALNLH